MNTRNWEIVAIVILASTLRLISLNQSFWLDEAINVTAARDLSTAELLTSYSIGDFHPPLYHLILWGWFRLLPVNEVTARLPSVIFGVATVAMAYLIARRITQNEKQFPTSPFIPALLLATSGLHIYYSQEARMYSLAALATTVTFYALLRLTQATTWLRSLSYVVALAILLLSDYQPWLLLPVLLILQPTLTSLATLILLPWWPQITRQVETGIATARAFPGWEVVVGSLTAKSLALVPVKFLIGRVSLESDLLYATVLVVPVLIVVIAIVHLFPLRSRSHRLVVAWIAVPFFLAILVSFWVPIFAYFRFLFLLPFFYLLIWLGIQKLTPKGRLLATSLLLLTNLLSTGAYLTMPRFQREDWRAAVGQLAGLNPTTSLVVFPNLAQAAGFTYYDTAGLRLQDKASLDLRSLPEDVILVRYVSDIFDPEEEIPQSLEQLGYSKSRESGVGGILMWHYQRQE